ncbi:MAG: 1-deoxy-D-xylulose-5-phosphate synthase [Bacteroidales bacterium]|nr:1-deoxy-D-xylulose-5-phosphate synthase [Bacteroidales bacterium]
MQPEAGEILKRINSPSDLKGLNEENLLQLCDELRAFIIDCVSLNPGHFGASLGVVELTVALHFVFNTPFDKIVWDVGHQAYAHKILTGRRDVFYKNRTYKGLSGFPKMKESPYDAFGVGHSSTSISAALGMAIASKLNKEKRHHIAVIGDGSMTGGMAFEALNNAGVAQADLLVILNDNGIAIDKSVGALKEYLTDISTSRTYNKLKDEVWKMLGNVGGTRAIIQKLDNAIKSSILKQSNLFEAMNFRYFGPVDGHDVIRLSKLLEDIRNIPGPKLLHCITKKGKGFEVAEKEQTKYHAPGYFNKDTGEISVSPCQKLKPPKFQDVFGHTLVELAEMNDKIVGVTPAMLSGCSLNIFQEKFPKRTFDVGIAEQHAVTFSAGMATLGYLPYCNIYSTFMQRAYDQIIHDVALQKLNVVLCLDRGGIVGEDGATHHGAFDIAYLRCVPNLIVASPLNEVELRNMLYTAQYKSLGPISIRYPRGNGYKMKWQRPFELVEIGKAVRITEGNDLAVLSFGPVGNNVFEAFKLLRYDNISFTHYDMRFAKPLDEEVLHYVFKTFNKVITVEDGVITGGFGSAILEFMNDNNYSSKVLRLGIPDRFIEQGKVSELHAECGFDTEGIVKTIKTIIKQ